VPRVSELLIGRRDAGARLQTAPAMTQLLVALDFSIIYVVLPSIGGGLDFSSAALQWVISAYAILFAGLLLLGGQLTDRFGGRVFLVGQVLFGAAPIVAALSPGAAVLVIARGGQGAAAALLVPSTLTLLNAAYPSGPACSSAERLGNDRGDGARARGCRRRRARELRVLSWRTCSGSTCRSAPSVWPPPGDRS
jgi:MFS family permease